MAKRIVTKIGNIFSAEVEGKYKFYLQYIANDMTQLNSSVIRVFKRRYPLDANPKMEDVVSDDVSFYAHTVLRWGIEKGIWHKVGKSDTLGLEKLSSVWFASFSTSHYDSELKQLVDSNPGEYWWIWHVNQPMQHIGMLTKELADEVEPGGVIPALFIVTRIERGYDMGTDAFFNDVKRVPWDDFESYTKLKDADSDDIAYFHFLGKKAVRMVIVASDGRKIHLDKNCPDFGAFKLFDGDFGDIYWEYYNFITPEEFAEVWK